MKKSIKTILVLSVAVAVLSGILVAFFLLPNQDLIEEDANIEIATEPEGNIIIYDDKVTATDPTTGKKLAGVITKIHIKNKESEFNVVPSDDGETTAYTIEEYKNIPQIQTFVNKLANNVNGLTYESIIEENCTDITKFGLADPKSIVEIIFETGTTCILYIGNEAPSNSVTYSMINGRNTVYTVKNSAILDYIKHVNDFIDKTILATPETYPVIESLRIKRKDLDFDIFLEHIKSNDSQYSGGTSAAHLMKEPTEAYIDMNKADPIITGMFGLCANDIFCLNVRESDIVKSNLTNPFCIVTMECDDGKSYVLLISKPFDDKINGRSCYVMMNGGNTIYIVQIDSLKWVTIQPIDIASTIFIATYVWSISDLSLTTNGKKYSFTVVRRNPSVEELNDPHSKDFKTTLNDKEIDTERFRQLFSFILSAKAETFALGQKPSGEPMVLLTYTDSYNKKDYDIKFYDYSNKKCLVVIGSESKFFVSKSYVQTLIDNLVRLETNEDFVTTWK